MVARPDIFEAKPNTIKWKVPKSKGLLPVFPAGISDEQKRDLAVEHVQTEEYILRAEKMETLLRNQVIKCVSNDYLEEIRDEITDYDEYSVQELWEHLFNRYGELGITEKKETMDIFHSAPNWDQHIDVYYARQQECQRVMKQTKTKISEASMVEQLVTHVAESAIVNKSRQKWQRHIENHPQDDNWIYAKQWHRREIKDVKDAQKDAGMESGTAFQALKSTQEIERDAAEQIRTDVSLKMGDSLTTIAAAATAKQEMMEQSSHTIAALTATNAELTSKIAKLLDKNAQLEAENKMWRQKAKQTVPGVTIKAEPDAECDGGDDLPMELNSNGQPCPVKRAGKNDSRIFFKNKQHCSHCNAQVWHLPKYCPENPEVKKRKAENKAKGGGKRRRY